MADTRAVSDWFGYSIMQFQLCADCEQKTIRARVVPLQQYGRSSHRTLYLPALWDGDEFIYTSAVPNSVEIRSLWILNLKYLEKLGSVWFRPKPKLFGNQFGEIAA